MPTIPPGLKKIISIAIFAGIVFFGARTCQVESAECELVFRLDASARKGVQEYEVRLFESGSTELIGQHRKQIHSGTSNVRARWPLEVAAGDYRIEGEIWLSAQRVRFEQEIELIDGEVIVVNLERYLPTAAK